MDCDADLGVSFTASVSRDGAENGNLFFLYLNCQVACSVALASVASAIPLLCLLVSEE